MKDTKQVIVMRTDLNMRKGKMCAQAAHASLAAILNVDHNTEAPDWEDKNNHNENGDYTGRILRIYQFPNQCDRWLENSFTKICVGINSEKELLEIYNKAASNGLICSLIKDNGTTEFNGIPTYTCCAIGPDYNEIIDEYTGTLKLL